MPPAQLLPLPYVQFWETENSWGLDGSHRGGHCRAAPGMVDASGVRTVIAQDPLNMVPDHPASMPDPYNLQRFVEAQNGRYEEVCAELRAGRKTSHWIWFVFPQLKGLGTSATSDWFAISSLDEARAYLRHPILGQRLRECTQLVNLVEGRAIREIFGSPDHLKFRSCMTLFAHATVENRVFLDALQKYSGSEFDPATLELLGQTPTWTSRS
jgi:uncharacterized protein (DUF1810 family)